MPRFWARLAEVFGAEIEQGEHGPLPFRLTAHFGMASLPSLPRRPFDIQPRSSKAERPCRNWRELANKLLHSSDYLVCQIACDFLERHGPRFQLARSLKYYGEFRLQGRSFLFPQLFLNHVACPL